MSLSIIIPVYNCEKYLEECLQSVCASKKDFEVVLVDDGSMDGSATICDNFALSDGRIKVFHKKNGGVSSARNYGIKRSSGDYIMFVDADDVLCDDWDKVFDYIVDDDVVYFCSREIDDKPTKVALLRYITGMNEKHIYLSGPVSKLYKRNFLEKNSLYFDEKLINGEDMLFNIEVTISASCYRVVNLQFYQYRQMVGQATKRFDKDIIKSDKEFHKKLHAVLSDSDVDGGLIKGIEDFCLMNAIILILTRLSYAKSYAMVRKYYAELEKEPYKSVANMKNNGSGRMGILIRLCKARRYRLLFLLLKTRSRLVSIVNKVRKKEFNEI